MENLVLDETINGNKIKVLEYEDKNGDPFFGITVLIPKERNSFQIMSGAKANTRCSFPLSGDAYDFFMNTIEGLGDKLRFATRTVYKLEADVWVDEETGEEVSNNRQSYCMPMTKSLFNEKWFDKQGILSEDAVHALSWMSPEEFVFNQDELEAAEEPVEKAVTADVDDIPF